MTIEGIGPTYPEAGVIATRPHTAPTEMPTADGFPFRTQSVSIQLTAAAAAARFVTTSASPAKAFAGRALPAFQPNPPTHSTDAPSITPGLVVCRRSRRPIPSPGPAS